MKRLASLLAGSPATRVAVRVAISVSFRRRAADTLVAGLLGAGLFMTHAPARAEGPLLIPNTDQITGGYVQTQLELNPCVDVHTLDADPDAALLKDAADARRGLPPGTCDSPEVATKLFTARFLQLASLENVDDPWRLDAQIDAQNHVLAQCRDTSCLSAELDRIIVALKPIYLKPRGDWPRGKALCAADPAAIPASRALAQLSAAQRRDIRQGCGEEAVTATQCDGPHGRLQWLSCEMSGNQVNAPEQLYRLGAHGADLLFDSEDGPSGVLDTLCNGVPDLLTSARVSMGEHRMTYYRFDGQFYQSVYSYSSLYVGNDSNGNDLAIAEGGPDQHVVCK